VGGYTAMNYDEEIFKMELQARLYAQNNAYKNAEVEVLKLKKRIDELEKTLASLKIEINKTEEQIKIKN